MSLPFRHAVLGTGTVGQAIASRLAQLDLEVRMGARSPHNEKAAAWAAGAGERAGHGSFAEVAAWADVVWNCTRGDASLEALQQAGARHLAGKVLVDLSNPLDFSQGMPPTLFVSGRDSLAEQIQRAFPEARVVKTLNTMNAHLMVQPDRLPEPTEVFMSGDDPAAKATVAAILRAFGWAAPLDLGPLETARGVESWLPLWIRLWGALGTAEFNLKLVRG